MSNQNSEPNSKWDKVSLYGSANKEEIMQSIYLFSSTQWIKQPLKTKRSLPIRNYKKQGIIWQLLVRTTMLPLQGAWVQFLFGELRSHMPVQCSQRKRGKKLQKWKQNYKCYNIYNISSVQSLSRVRLFATPWTAAHQASLSNTNSQSLPKLMSICRYKK